MKSNKAQMEQVFTYIMTGIIIVAILGFGVVQIMKIGKSADQIACLDFKQSLQEKIDSSKSHSGILKSSLLVDCDYRYIWFVDLQNCKNDYSDIADPIIKNSCKDGVKQNVFMGNDIAEDFFYVEGLKVNVGEGNGGVLEFELGSRKRIYAKFQGVGNGMIISKDESSLED